MIEKPMPPKERGQEEKDANTIIALRNEIKQMKEDMVFLESLLKQVQEEFSQYKNS